MFCLMHYLEHPSDHCSPNPTLPSEFAVPGRPIEIMLNLYIIREVGLNMFKDKKNYTASKHPKAHEESYIIYNVHGGCTSKTRCNSTLEI